METLDLPRMVTSRASSAIIRVASPEHIRKRRRPAATTDPSIGHCLSVGLRCQSGEREFSKSTVFKEATCCSPTLVYEHVGLVEGNIGASTSVQALIRLMPGCMVASDMSNLTWCSTKVQHEARGRAYKGLQPSGDHEGSNRIDVAVVHPTAWVLWEARLRA